MGGHTVDVIFDNTQKCIFQSDQLLHSMCTIYK